MTFQYPVIRLFFRIYYLLFRLQLSISIDVYTSYNNKREYSIKNNSNIIKVDIS